jgi:hypothetical protein
LDVIHQKAIQRRSGVAGPGVATLGKRGLFVNQELTLRVGRVTVVEAVQDHTLEQIAVLSHVDVACIGVHWQLDFSCNPIILRLLDEIVNCKNRPLCVGHDQVVQLVVVEVVDSHYLIAGR